MIYTFNRIKNILKRYPTSRLRRWAGKGFVFASLCGWIFLFLVLPDVNAIETPGPMIEIAVNIYEYRLDHENQLGLFYQYTSKDGAIKDSQLYLPGTTNTRDTPIPALDLVTTLAKFDYGRIDINLKAAIEEGRASIISNPTILTADGQKASIISGEEIPLTVLKLQGVQTMLSTETRPTGIKLIVTPRIYGDNNILMDLEIESSEIARFDIFDRGNRQRFELPVISKRNIKSVVMIPSDQQLYIGGLYTNNIGDLVRKLPIVGDVPVFGHFFRGANKQKIQSETVFQLTPSIRIPGSGISTEDSLFKDILRSDEKMDIISEQRILDEADDRSPFQGLIPQPGPEQILGATEIQSATGHEIVPPQEIPGPDLTTPSTVPMENTTQSREPKKVKRSARPGRR